jgi:multisubunit Na+/H+ antiporter MnhE subunit
MWAFFRREALYFLVGFVVAFVIYLFIRFEANDVLIGMGIAAIVGLAFAVLLGWMEKRFDEGEQRTQP